MPNLTLPTYHLVLEALELRLVNAEPCPSLFIVPLPLPLFIYVSYILIFSF